MSTNAAIYTRISRDDQGDQLGVARQEKECRKAAKARGWSVADVFSDNDTTAASRKVDRPGFDALMAAITSGQADAVLATDLDRITRRPRQLEEFVDACEDAGVTEVVLPLDPVADLTGGGMMMARVKSAVAAEEIRKATIRVRAKKDELAERGIPAGGGARAYGYTADGMKEIDDEADRIREAASAILDGESQRSVCRRWNDEGVPTVSGAQWSTPVLRGILTSPRIAGLRQHRGEVVGRAAWPAIVDRETFEAVGAVIRQTQAMTSPAQRRRDAHLLTGLLVCGRCGGSMVSATNNSKRGYKCRTDPGKRAGCGLSIIAVPLEEMIVAMVAEALDDTELADSLRADRNTVDADALAREIEGAEARLAELGRQWAEGEIGTEERQGAATVLRDKIDAARAKLATRTTRTAVDDLLMTEGFAVRWPNLDGQARRRALAGFIDSIEVAPAVRGRRYFDPARATVTWRV